MSSSTLQSVGLGVATGGLYTIAQGAYNAITAPAKAAAEAEANLAAEQQAQLEQATESQNAQLAEAAVSGQGFGTRAAFAGTTSTGMGAPGPTGGGMENLF